MAGLDDLDLDDMFNDDGDMLFEGLDIELDGMGDIISNEKKEKPGTVAPPPPPRRTGGPRTKRTNPMLEKAAEEQSDTPTRRKTKRKSKAPTAFDDEDFVEEQPKKKRKAALKAKKATEPIVKAKRKKKSEEPIQIPPPTAFGGPNIVSKAKSTGPTVAVAAAGQFGGRIKRGSATSTGSTKLKRKLKKSAEAVAEQPSSVAVAPKLEPIPAPKPEPTFGGLHPSKVLFYPFLEAVPPEPSMQKRKAYPIMDRINSALTTHITNAPSASAANPPSQEKPPTEVVSEDSPIFKLMLETFEGSDKEKSPANDERKAGILKGIPEMRGMIQSLDRQKLVGDVFSMCWLLTRQYNFIKQSMDNMQSWCKEWFTDEDYRDTFEPPVEKPNFNKWKSPIVRLKLTFNGYKETKATPSIIGILPPMVVDAPKHALTVAKTKAAEAKKVAAAAKSATATTKTKKKNEKATDKTKVKASPAKAVTVSTSASVSIPRTYVHSAPQSRRQQIMEKVAQLAVDLESPQRGEYTGGRLQSIPNEDPPLQTSRMWDFLQTAGFYKPPPSKRLDLRSPEVHPRKPFLAAAPKIHGCEETCQLVSGNSLFDRLQSMLVDEGCDEDEASNDDDSDSEVSLSFLDNEDEDLEVETKWEEEEVDEHYRPDLADLSELSLEERTFIHLSSVGLIRQSLFPKVELVLSKGKTDEQKEERSAEDELVNVIAAMSSDLSKITSSNNKRISYLEAVAADTDLHYSKQVEDEHGTIIARCQNMLKRSKERAKKAKQKKDENLNLPW